MSEKPRLEPRDDKKTWVLLEDYGEVPRGFVTDGGSIPRFFWRVIGSPMEAATCGPYIRHDWRYQTGLMSRADADDALYEELREAGVGYARAKAIYLAVRACGWRHYNNTNNQKEGD